MGPCFYGWIVWFILLIGSITVFMGASSGVTFIIDPVREDLKLTQTEIALSYTLGTAFSALAQIPMGKSIDRWGGRMGVTVYSAAFFMSVACLSLPHTWIGLSAGFALLRALGVGGLELACNTCLQQWFSRRRGLATGLLQSTNALVSYGIISNVISALVDLYGWRRTYLYIGCALLVSYPLLAFVLLRSRPEDIGLFPDGDAAPPITHQGGATRGLQTASSLDDGNEDEAEKEASGHGPPDGGGCVVDDGSFTLAQAMRTRALLLLACANALFCRHAAP